MRTVDGEEISPYGLLHGKMMAKAAQDPNFHAVLSAEVNRAPLALEAAGGPQPGHQRTLHRADLPFVYQATLADGSGAPTYQLLAGEGMAQDNRLLPAGWRVDGEDTELGSFGPVGTDGHPDFGPGGDHVALVLEGLVGTPPASTPSCSTSPSAHGMSQSCPPTLRPRWPPSA